MVSTGTPGMKSNEFLQLLEERRVDTVLVPDKVPLVGGDDEPTPCLDRVPSDVPILRARTFGCIDDEHTDIAALQRPQRAKQAVALDILGHDTAPPDAGGIDQPDHTAVELHNGVDDVTCRSRDR